MLRWKKILVGTDFSPSSRVALRSAIALAERVGATLHVVHVMEPLAPRYEFLLGSFDTTVNESERMRRAGAHLNRLLGRVRAPGVALEGDVRRGRAWEQLLGAAREVEARIICIGNSGHSRLERLLLGSTAENVVRHSPIPVLVTRRRPLRKIARAILPLDFSAGAEAAARFAARRLPVGVRLHAVHVVPPPPPMPEFFTYDAEPAILKRQLRSLLAKAGVRKASLEVVVFEDPAQTILNRSRSLGADVILISTHGRSGLDRLMLGSLAEKVIRYADVPVLVLPGPRSGARAGRARAASKRRRAD